MPLQFVRVASTQDLYFISLGCPDRLPLLDTPVARDRFEQCLEKVQRLYRLDLHGYVVMPEQVHMLLRQPASYPLATTIQTLKEMSSRRLASETTAFWQPRYEVTQIANERKRLERLRYMHHSPVMRGLVNRPEDWRWSSYGMHAEGLPGAPVPAVLRSMAAAGMRADA